MHNRLSENSLNLISFIIKEMIKTNNYQEKWVHKKISISNTHKFFYNFYIQTYSRIGEMMAEILLCQ